MPTACKKISKLDCIRSVVGTVQLFQHLPEPARESIARVASCQSYVHDDVIFSAGDDPASAKFLVSGLVLLATSTTGRNPLGVDIVSPPDPFGLLAVVNQFPYPLTALALESSVVLSVPAKLIREIFDENPTIKDALLRIAAQRFAEAQHVIRSLSGASARSRLAYALLLLLRRKHLLEQSGSGLPITRKQLACIGGTTVETCIREMKAFEQEGIVRTPGTRCIEVLQTDKLEALAI